MQGWKNGGGFSLNGQVKIEASDRKGLERLLRYCARPIFSGERLSWKEEDEQLIYQLPKPSYDGQTQLQLTPGEFLDRIAALIPQPRKHRQRYHGVLAPNGPLRKEVTARAGLPVDAAVAVDPVGSKPTEQEESSVGLLTVSIWAMLIARIYEINPLVCSKCGSEMRIIAFVMEVEPISKILNHIGESDLAPEISPARDPPDLYLEFNQTPEWELTMVEQVPEFEFDQTVSW